MEQLGHRLQPDHTNLKFRNSEQNYQQDTHLVLTSHLRNAFKNKKAAFKSINTKLKTDNKSTKFP